ncbi:universal stress protein [Thermocoleostomius sinensis]|jgi:nucleotide-binding universal stress UspA family protein|uniref:Universal stress protein n=1 Tax=Thermocoleostomius sinensis A174 TaxID=2016057 RepID=A0A9E8ZB58_9CYAN|nr:universal stress protein [Thermocoleostomius sinensis]WAL58632.1 universal stress protein [Thermocoleostomius sinensis A174]
MGFQKILAAIDHSPLSDLVFNQALELAKANQSKLLLFHCVTADTVILSPSFAGEFGVPSRIMSQAYQTEVVRIDQQIHHIQALLKHYRELATQQQVAVEADYKTAEPGQGLCQMAQQWGADLLVLGRRGRKGLTEALLGSVSNYVLHHAPCAVLVIQAPNGASTRSTSSHPEAVAG